MSMRQNGRGGAHTSARFDSELDVQVGAIQRAYGEFVWAYGDSGSGELRERCKNRFGIVAVGDDTGSDAVVSAIFRRVAKPFCRVARARCYDLLARRHADRRVSRTTDRCPLRP